MKRVTSVLRRFHLIKEPPESDTRQRLKKELFACNSVSCIIFNHFVWSNICLYQLQAIKCVFTLNGWLVGVMVSALDLRSRGHGFDSWPFRYSSNNSPGQVVHTHVPLSPSSINWYRSKRRKGNDSMWERCGLPPS